MPQSQLPEFARRVLRVEERRFRDLVRRLARKVLLIEHFTRRNSMAQADIIIGYVRPEASRYEVVAEVPFCRGRYGDGRGVVYAHVKHSWVWGFSLFLGSRCVRGRAGEPTEIAVANVWEEAITRPSLLYDLYKFLYKEQGVGARPLLELAMKAEAEGNREVASMLKKLYAILEASRDIIDEIEQADYSGVEAEVREEAEREAEKKVEEAVQMLRRAKELARRGDTEHLDSLLNRGKAIETPSFSIFLIEIIYHLETGDGVIIRHLLSFSTKGLGTILRETDIFDVFITAAEHFGLEVRR